MKHGKHPRTAGKARIAANVNFDSSIIVSRKFHRSFMPLFLRIRQGNITANQLNNKNQKYHA